MSGQFSGLKSGSPARAAFWRSQEPVVKQLLEEVNSEVFDGKGKFGRPNYLSIYFRRPPLTDPYICLKLSSGSIAICPRDSETLLIIAENTQGVGDRYREFLRPPSDLVDGLRAAVRFTR
jgi:hypothetical protein